ncbi:MAG TPA: type II secretion system protein [Verrucomicrobiae bacterium]
MKRVFSQRRHRGFNLIELLVVLAVLFIFFGLLFPPMGGSRKGDPKIGRCMTNLKQLSVVMQMYSADQANLLPWQTYEIAGQTNSARKLILPNRSVRQNLDVFTNYTGNSPKLFLCPADPKRSLKNNRPDAGNLGASYFVGLNEYFNAATVPMLGDRNISPAAGQPLYSSVKGKPVLVDTNSSAWGEMANNKFHEGKGAFGFTDGHAEWGRSPKELLSYATGAGVTNANWFLFPQ